MQIFDWADHSKAVLKPHALPWDEIKMFGELTLDSENLSTGHRQWTWSALGELVVCFSDGIASVSANSRDIKYYLKDSCKKSRGQKTDFSRSQKTREVLTQNLLARKPVWLLSISKLQTISSYLSRLYDVERKINDFSPHRRDPSAQNESKRNIARSF